MKIYLVGGAVRDKLLGLPITERDWVVVGATIEDMLKLGYRQVGKEFPVFLHPQTNEEYALARMERKVKPGYQGFTFDTSPLVTLEDDLKRRDLTINAMVETAEGELIDPYHGKEDLKHKMLRHVSAAFGEDPVRILRTGRFLARYAHLGFYVAPDTLRLMQAMVQSGEVNALVAERVWKELERALGEKNPEKFFELLNDCQALTTLFPHLSIQGSGLKALVASAKITEDKAIRFAMLCHDLPEETSNKIPAKLIINGWCDRYRAPNAYRELALLAALHSREIIETSSFSAEKLLHLFNLLDIYRRDERFKKFLMACQAIAQVRQINFNLSWMVAAADVAKSVDIKALMAKGFTNQKLAMQLKMERLEKLTMWLKNQHKK